MVVVLLVAAVNFVSAASFDVGDRWTSIQDAIGSTASVFSLTDRRPKVQLLPTKGYVGATAVALTGCWWMVAVHAVW